MEPTFNNIDCFQYPTIRKQNLVQYAFNMRGFENSEISAKITIHGHLEVAGTEITRQCVRGPYCVSLPRGSYDEASLTRHFDPQSGYLTLNLEKFYYKGHEYIRNGEALNLRFNSFFNWAFDVKNEKYPLWKLAAHNIAAGSAAGLSSLAVIHPINYVRTRLANDLKFKWGNTHREFTGVVDVMKKTLSTDGVAGMYRGYKYALTRVALTHGMYFGLYNTLQHKDVKQDTVLLAMLGGGCTAVTFATYPLDTLSKRMMMTSGQSHNFNDSYDAFRRIEKMEGSRGLFSGTGARLLFMATGGLLLFGVEESLTLFVACA